MASLKNFDVFLSHNSVDKPWVIKLKNALQTHGLSVWLDKDEIRPGDLFAEVLEVGLEASKSIVLIVSPKSIESGWVKEEYYRALSLSKSKSQPVRLIPVILRTAEIPGFLSSRLWVDFRDESSFAENLKKLVWGINGQQEEIVDVVEVPFVVLAMNLTQAQDLFDGKFLEDEKIDKFRKTLLNNVVFQYSGIYGETPEDWRFPYNSENKISNIIWQTIEDLNDKLQETPEIPVFVPKFESSDFLSSDFATYTKTWDRLKRSGCVLIVDAISLFHPDIIKQLKDFHVEPSDNVAMAVISPVDTYANPILEMIEIEMRNHLQMAFIKFETYLDKKCEIGIGDVRGLKRWIFSSLPETAEFIRKQKLKPSNRERIRKIMGEPKGIDRLIFGSGGVK